MPRIHSKVKWNDVGINVVMGRRYRFTATGTWKDASIVCDADGFSHMLLDVSGFLKRVPSAKWFQLVATVRKNMLDKVILGRSGTFRAPASGRLWAFANDADLAYGNNSGSVVLTVREV